jgi:hypothetical protein
MSDRKPARAAQVNEGIQATNVNAEVIAVGRGAKAYKATSGDSQELTKAMDQLRAAIEALNLQPHAKAAITEDLTTLRTVAQANQPQPDRAGHALQSLAGKLKMVGVVLSEAVTLSEPVRRIAELLRVPLHLLGL